MSPEVFTVGHSNTSARAFVAKLMANGITAIADVRSRPYSAYVPHFGQAELKATLRGWGIAYSFLGRELGARAEDPDVYVDGQVNFARLAQTDLFRSGIDRVIQGSRNYRIALMCAEKEPMECHRTILVARALAEAGYDVRHILDDGSVETHEETMDRLMDLLKIPRFDMFLSREVLLEDAYEARAKQIAYAPGV
ncbi:DUF488 family protein [Salipiger mucosus]|uniref:DUF488 domain-containing protein n=1 Tax=Salipiger mucosus DSM 16094 TaxID=1123237 RepID=S9QDZ4_9RHOB|nr:DUF488 domain-containing protein [Salipiger mucosus]EPX78112.1 hypothetical protein Salmuc_03464 [Salipiger mucosus DSM 16094]